MKKMTMRIEDDAPTRRGAIMLDGCSMSLLETYAREGIVGHALGFDSGQDGAQVEVYS